MIARTLGMGLGVMEKGGRLGLRSRGASMACPRAAAVGGWESPAAALRRPGVLAVAARPTLARQYCRHCRLKGGDGESGGRKKGKGGVSMVGRCLYNWPQNWPSFRMRRLGRTRLAGDWKLRSERRVGPSPALAASQTAN